MESSPNYVNPKISSTLLQNQKISVNYALAYFQNSKWSACLIVHFILWTVYSVLRILHYVTSLLFILYYRIFYQSSFLAATVVINACLV